MKTTRTLQKNVYNTNTELGEERTHQKNGELLLKNCARKIKKIQDKTKNSELENIVHFKPLMEYSSVRSKLSSQFNKKCIKYVFNNVKDGLDEPSGSLTVEGSHGHLVLRGGFKNKTTSMHVAYVNFLKAHYRKAISKIINEHGINRLTTGCKNTTITKISLNHAQNFYKSFTNSRKIKKFYKENVNSKTNKEKQEEMKKYLKDENYRIQMGKWKNDESLQIIHDVVELIEDPDNLKNYQSILSCLSSKFNNKSKTNVEAKVEELFGQMHEILQKFYDDNQYINFYKLRFSNLKKKIKQQIEKEIISINIESKYLKKALEWFKTIKFDDEKLKLELEHVLDNEDLIIFFTVKIEKHCNFVLKEDRFSKFLENGILFFEKKITTITFFFFLAYYKNCQLQKLSTTKNLLWYYATILSKHELVWKISTRKNNNFTTFNIKRTMEKYTVNGSNRKF